MKTKKNNKGLTLIELMVALLIVGIVLLFAIPSYDKYKIKVEESDAKISLLKIVQSMETFFMYNKTYAGINNNMKNIALQQEQSSTNNFVFNVLWQKDAKLNLSDVLSDCGIKTTMTQDLNSLYVVVACPNDTKYKLIYTEQNGTTNCFAYNNTNSAWERSRCD